MYTLTAKQKKLYNKLCDQYNNIGMIPVFTLQAFIYSKYEKNRTEDLHAVYLFSTTDF